MTVTSAPARRSGQFLLQISRILAGAMLAVLTLLSPAQAEPRNSTADAIREYINAPVELVLFNRDIAELRGTLGGLDPRQRVARAGQAFFSLSNEALEKPLEMRPISLDEGSGYTFLIDNQPLFTLLVTDLDPESRLALRSAADKAKVHLLSAQAARLEQGSLRSILVGGATLLLLLLVGYLILWAAVKAYGYLVVRATSLRSDSHPLTYLRVLGLRLAGAAVWLLVGFAAYGCAVVLLDAFPYTRPWGGGLADFVRALGGWLATGVMGAIPGLITVAVILVVTKSVQDVLGMFFKNVQDGVIRVPFMHADTVSATRRLTLFFVWGLATAIAYPYLPGSGSDAFKGVSVLVGLMVTLGSSGLVTQLMSGLVVVYSRSLQKGDTIIVNQIEGVVTEVGPLAVKVATIRNEEVTIPNNVITGSPIYNHSRLAGMQGTLISTKVTIGYDTPWRQVHAMLTAAALATPGIRSQPEPTVLQRALSDFYVEYELFANIDDPYKRPLILSALLAAIQDQFNTHGVQIMSPHFALQPREPVVVPPDRWHEAPARP